MTRLIKWLKKKFIRTEYIYYDVVKVGMPVKPGETFYSDDFWLENTGKHTIYIGKHPNDFEYISKNITNVKGVNIDG